MAEVSDYLADGRNVVWFDLCSPTVEELAVVGEELGLHELAVEDVHNDHQRPKVDIYDNHLFIAVYAAHFDGENVDLAEVDLFVTANALVTVRQSDRFDIDEVLRRWDAAPHLAGHGVAFLLHGVLDYVVDGHLAVVQELDAQAETLEDALFEERPSGGRELQRRMYDLRKATVRFRKVTMPMRRSSAPCAAATRSWPPTPGWPPTTRTYTTTRCAPANGSSHCATCWPTCGRPAWPSRASG